MDISVSILNASNKKNMIEILNNTSIKYIHMDVMDGIFVKEKSLDSDELRKLSLYCKKKMDIHLMVDNPLNYINKIKDLNNIEYITIHYEIDRDIRSILLKIKEYGFKCGLAIKPSTDLNVIKDYLDIVDLILLMTVEPGYGGQTFMDISVDRLKLLKDISYDKVIEVDGGINIDTIDNVNLADLFVVGSYITKSDNPIKCIENLVNKKSTY